VVDVRAGFRTWDGLDRLFLGHIVLIPKYRLLDYV